MDAGINYINYHHLGTPTPSLWAGSVGKIQAINGVVHFTPYKLHKQLVIYIMVANINW